MLTTEKKVWFMADFIVLAIVIILFASALAYIIKAKKNGAKCIGCPACGSCGQKPSAECKGKNPIEKGRLIVGTKTVKIKGMHCDHCRQSVEKALNSIEGLKASVDIGTGEARIIAEAVDENEIKSAIEELGFTVESIS